MVVCACRVYRHLPVLLDGKCRSEIHNSFQCRCVSLAPFFTAAVSKFENPNLKLSLQFFVGSGLSFIGVLLIVFGENMSLTINPLGDSLAVGAAFVWAIYSVALKKLAVYQAPILVSTRTIFGYGLIFIFGANG